MKLLLFSLRVHMKSVFFFLFCFVFMKNVFVNLVLVTEYKILISGIRRQTAFFWFLKQTMLYMSCITHTLHFSFFILSVDDYVVSFYFMHLQIFLMIFFTFDDVLIWKSFFYSVILSCQSFLITNCFNFIIFYYLLHVFGKFWLSLW